jgi:uncharacterized protein (TIGR02145 family)
MKTIALLCAFYILSNLLHAQNEKITVYNNDGSRTIIDLSLSDSISVFICGESKAGHYGKLYNTVLIGDQCWLKENLDVGTRIDVSQSQSDNGIFEKYCYDDNPNNCDTYGGLYYWNEAMQYVITEGAQGICPPDWHIPTLAEFQTLTAMVSNNSLALIASSKGGSNTSGFSALLAGASGPDGGGYFFGLGNGNYFWTSSEVGGGVGAYYMWLTLTVINLTAYAYGTQGFSVRCVMD